MALITVEQGLSFVQYEADGVTTQYPLIFDYIDQDHIKVFIGNTEVTYTWINASTITPDTAAVSGDIVTVRRFTPNDARLVDFQDGGQLSEALLDKDSTQMFYLAQESADTVNFNLTLDPLLQVVDFRSNRGINLATPIDPTDAANKDYVDDELAAIQATVAGAVSTANAASAAAISAANDAADAEAAALAAQAAAEAIEGIAQSAVTAVNDHISDTTDAHDASAISVVASNGMVATQVQAALDEHQGDINTISGNVSDLDTAIADHLSDTSPHATIIGSSIQTPSRLDVKQGTESDLITYATTASNGQLVFSTDTKEMFQVIDGTLMPVGGSTFTDTGLIFGGELTVNVDNTKFDVSAGEGYVTDMSDPSNPVTTKVTWAAKTAQTVTNLASADVTYVLMDSTGNLVQQTSFPTPENRRDYIFLGRLPHINRTNLTFAIDLTEFIQSPSNQLYDLLDALGPFIMNGVNITANGANLSINRTAGSMFNRSYNLHANPKDPHKVSISASSPVTIRYGTQTTYNQTDVTVLDPTKYDNAGTVTTVPTNNNATIQRVYLFPTGTTRVYYGQTVYSSFANALSNFDNDPFVENPNSVKFAVHIANVVITKSCTSLQDSSCARIIPISKFGGAGGGGGGSTTLQQAYINSINPEITTNASLGALTVKRGSAADTDNVFEIENGAGTTTASIKGNGDISGGNLNLTGNINALNYQNQNLLVNPNFEGTSITDWTCTGNTCTRTTTANEYLIGGAALKVVLGGNVLDVKQTVTTNAAQLSGVQMVASIWVKSDDVSDIRLCSMKNGAEDKCTVTGGYVQGSGWRQLTVSFLGDSTSNGLKLTSTDTTGTVLVDQAYVGIGSPIVDFTPDMVYSAKVSATGVVTEENTDWISGNCTGSSPYTCTFSSGIFTTAPNCVATQNTANNSGFNGNIGISSLSSTSLTVRTVENNSNSNISFIITCQKQGADYKTSKAYVASSSDFGYTNAGAITITATTTNPTKGTVVTDRVFASRDGQRLKAIYQYDQTTGGSNGSGEYLFSLPSGLSFDSSFVGFYTGAQFGASENKAIVGWGKINTGSNTSTFVSLVAYDSTRFRVYAVDSTSVRGYIGSAFYALSGAVGFVFNLDAPIQGWTDSSVIVGSFQGYNETPGTSRVEMFSVSYGTTNSTTSCSASPCSYLDQIGNAVTSITRSGVGVYTINFNKTFTKLKCTSNLAESAAGYPAGVNSANTLQCSNCSSMSFNTYRISTNASSDSNGNIVCQGIPQ